VTVFHVVPLPGAGHVNPMLPVAAELVRRGEEVHVWLPAPYAAAARATGARYREVPEVPVPSPGRGRRGLRDLPQAVRTVRRIARTLRRPPEGVLAELGPDAVLVHDVMGLWARRVTTPRVAFSASTVTDGAGLAAGLAGPAARLLRRDPGAVRDRLLRSPLPRLLDRVPLPVNPGGAPAIVAVPRVLQPDADRFGPEVVFVGPCLEPRPTEAADPLPDALDGEARPLVLVALGSAFNDRPEFYRACAAAFAGRPWRVVMAIGERTDPAALGPPAENVTVARTVPQLRLLERAAAFVSHAGMGSVQESLAAGVPLVLFPQMTEQRANARRVAEHGAGVLLGPAPTPGEIRAAVERVVSDPAVAAAVAGLREAARTAGGQRRAADVLQELAAAAAGNERRPEGVARHGGRRAAAGEGTSCRTGA
jgi:UDP:flavonoid glycosyltransferase YjiC (YdhE family)